MVKEIVKIEDLYFYYDSSLVLEGIDLTVYENDYLAIIGPNGGGKTTLLRIILGLLRPSKGRISVLGQEPSSGRREIGYLKQSSDIDRDFPIDVFDTVMMGRYKGIMKKYTEDDREATKKALETLGIYELRKKHIGMLSGGQLQRVLLARAIVRQPKLLLLDEPLNSIGADMQKEIYELFLELSKKMAVVFVTHDISAISKYMDKIACLNRRLYYHGPKEGSIGKLEEAYKCPVEILAHGIPHRVLKEH